MTQKYPVEYHTKGTKCKKSEILNVYTRLFLFVNCTEFILTM